MQNVGAFKNGTGEEKRWKRSQSLGDSAEGIRATGFEMGRHKGITRVLGKRGKL